MIVYKLTCSTGRVYYGSTSKALKVRANKGWYNCACCDFDIIKMEVIEEIDGDNKQLLLERESYYIENFVCVNKNTAKQTPEYKRKMIQERYKKKKESGTHLDNAYKHRNRVIEEKRFHCNLCNQTLQSPGQLTSHEEGYRHKLKEKCKEEVGEDWRSHYILWRGRRNEETRKKKKNALHLL